MRRSLAPFVLLLSVVLLACGVARARELTQADREKAVQYLESTKKGVLDATKDLTPAQSNFKPAPDRWSIAECMEHIAFAEDFIRGNIIEKVMVAPAVPGRDFVKIDEAIITMVPDRTNKVQAPEPLKPTKHFGSPQAAIDHFVDSRAKTEDFVKTTPGLRDHAVDSPGNGQWGKWDAYEFVLLIATHSERDSKQINEVKADPNFPKN